jgi:tRNA1Val (adenine37-N6)-methyltransferase
MKVGTDGVLLGAWTDCENAERILDVGTGSGLIALMLAQRSQTDIDAIDVDENAYKQSSVNFHNSIFSRRINNYHMDFRQYTTRKTYDLIVSNPPYFTNSMQSPDKNRSTARHTHQLDFETLLRKSNQLLSDNGRLSIILPYESLIVIQEIAERNQLHLSRKTIVRPLENHPPKRVLLEFSKVISDTEENELFIEKSRRVYSDDYICLTKDFYL